MTERLYYHDSNLLEFEATIVRTGEQDGRTFTVLDKSAFYPTSGGQQYDTGRLNTIDIVDVQEGPEGEVLHFSGQPVGAAGTVVAGVVDKERRRRHCCFHTAQHILSHIFATLFDMPTVSVHLGEEYGAVELQGRMPSSEQLDQVEKRANEIIREAHPVTIIFAEGDELASMPLRKPPQRGGKIRVVRIGELECVACGGTHCSNSAEVGMLKIVGLEKLRGHPLVKFLVAERAFEDYRSRFEVTSQLAQSLTCHHQDLPDKFAVLAAESKTIRRQLTDLYKELLPRRAEVMAAKARLESKKLVCSRSDLPDARLTGQLAPLVADEINGVALLVHDTRLFVACAQGSRFDAGELAKQLSERFSLKGGGNGRLAQLGGVEADKLAEIEAFLNTVMQG